MSLPTNNTFSSTERPLPAYSHTPDNPLSSSIQALAVAVSGVFFSSMNSPAPMPGGPSTPLPPGNPKPDSGEIKGLCTIM